MSTTTIPFPDIKSPGVRKNLRLDGEGSHTLVAHVPQSDLAGATEGDLVSVDLRNPKAFDRVEAEAVSQGASEVATAE